MSTLLMSLLKGARMVQLRRFSYKYKYFAPNGVRTTRNQRREQNHDNES